MTSSEAVSKEIQSNIRKLNNIKSGTSLIVNIEGVNETFDGTFIGMEKDNFLMIDVNYPSVIIKNKFVAGAMLVLKYFEDGTIFAFQTKIKSVLNNPIKVIVTDFPNVIQDFSIRKQKRVACYIPIITKIKDNQVNGILKDISLEGAFCIYKLSSATGLKLEDKITMLCQFPGFTERQPLQGIVKTLRRNGQILKIGMEFNQKAMSTDVKDVIKHYIEVVDCL